MIAMTRRVMFSAGTIDLPPAATMRPAGETAAHAEAPEPYGHNYFLDVTVTGEIDPRTGIVVNIKEIDRIVRERIIDRLDRKLIQRQAPELCGRPVTPESLAEWIANALRGGMPEGVTLSAVRLEETPLAAAEWIAERPMTNQSDKPGGAAVVRSTRSYEFAASHRLHSPQLSDEENRELFGKCNYANGHGHNYVLEVTVQGPIDPRTARVISAEALDEIVNREVVDRYDHRHLNYDIPEFEGLVPSTEIVTKTIWQRLVDKIPPPARLAGVLIRETARNIFEYRGEA
jgi:6-pyruvoyltetrahydropterin/6-carboxytetrahydropterin synthase